MARNPEYQFISTDSDIVIDNITAVYEEIMGRTVEPASPEELFIHFVALIVVQLRSQINYAANQNIPSRADGDNLDALAELFFVTERRLERPAKCTVKFKISEAQSSPVLIPGGTRVTDASETLYWATEENAYIPAKSTETELSVTCQTSGIAGNGWKPGTINTIVDVYDYYTGCENTTESDGGSDRQSDEELYEAMRLSMDALSTAGPEGSYVYHAKSVSTEIEDVSVITPAPGEVSIYVLTKEGKSASEELKAAILEACNARDVRPLTDLVKMADPEEVTYNIDMTYYITEGSNISNEEYDRAVKEAVAEYNRWQCAKLGRDINPSKLISLVMQTGVKRVDVRAPVFTELKTGRGVSLGQSKPTIPQVAKLGTSTIKSGGTETD